MDYQDDEDSRSTIASSEASQDMEYDDEYDSVYTIPCQIIRNAKNNAKMLDNYIFNFHHNNTKSSTVHYRCPNKSCGTKKCKLVELLKVDETDIPVVPSLISVGRGRARGRGRGGRGGQNVRVPVPRVKVSDLIENLYQYIIDTWFEGIFLQDIGSSIVV